MLIIYYFEVPIEAFVWNDIKNLKLEEKGFLYVFGFIATPLMVIDLLLGFNIGIQYISVKIWFVILWNCGIPRNAELILLSHFFFLKNLTYKGFY